MKIEKVFNRFEAEHRKYKHELLKTYDLYIKKLVSIFGLNQSTDYVVIEDLITKNMINFSANKEFKGVYVDFEYLNLNGKLLNSYDRNYYPLDAYDNLRNLLSRDDIQQFDRIVLLLNKENEFALETKELKKLRSYVEAVSNKRTHMRYLFLYLTLYLSQKEGFIKLNTYVIELIELAIEEYLPMLFTGSTIDHETLLYILYVCYEINNNSHLSGQKGLSSLFVNFLKNLNCWYKHDCWRIFIENLERFLENPYLSFHYLEKQTWLVTDRKVSILYKKDMYQYLMLIGCHFLNLPFKSFMDILNAINTKREDITLNSMIDLTKIIEVYMIEDNGVKDNPKVLFSNKETYVEKLCTVFELVFLWIEVRENCHIKLISINNFIYGALRRRLAKHYLALDITKYQRLSMWAVVCSNNSEIETNNHDSGHLIPKADHKHMKISKLTSSRHLLNFDSVTNNSRNMDELLSTVNNGNKPMSLPSEDDLVLKSTEENFISLIKLDVKRTNFAKNHKDNLKKLLITLARRYPILMYYQGMNCIGGFLLTYTLNYPLSLDVFSYIIEHQLAESFQKSFIELSKLIFICEKLLEKYNKRLFDQLQKFTNSADFYLSPLILTIFSSSMQTIDTSDFIAVVFDFFIKEKWMGLFKVILTVFTEMEKELLSLHIDRLAVFLKKDLFERFLTLDLVQFKHKVSNCCINKNEIKNIEIEYNRSRKIVETYWREFYELRRGRHNK